MCSLPAVDWLYSIGQSPAPVANILRSKVAIRTISIVTWHDKMADADGRGVESILAAHREQYRTVQVDKDIGVHYDVGNMTVSDVNLLDNDALKYVALLRLADGLQSPSHSLVFPACI